MYIIKRFVRYSTEFQSTSFVINDRICLELSSDMSRAKRYKTKREAQTVVDKYKRSANEKFTIKQCEV